MNDYMIKYAIKLLYNKKRIYESIYKRYKKKL